MEKWESRQVGRRQVITFCAPKRNFVAEIVAPPSSSSLHAGLYLGSAFGVKPYSLQEWLSARVPNRLATPIKDIAMTKPILGLDIAKDSLMRSSFWRNSNIAALSTTPGLAGNSSFAGCNA